MKKTNFNPFCKSDNVANNDDLLVTVNVNQRNSKKMWLFGRKSKVKPHEIKEIQHNVKLDKNLHLLDQNQLENEKETYFYNDNSSYRHKSHG